MGLSLWAVSFDRSDALHRTQRAMLRRDEYAVGPLPWAAGETPVESFAGYVPIRNQSHNGEGDPTSVAGSMFYWFFPAQEPVQENPPLIVWLQGGPGSSSMIGLFYEMGPLGFDAKGKLVRNTDTWNKKYSMLFIDNPVGTGFSFVGNKTAKETKHEDLEYPWPSLKTADLANIPFAAMTQHDPRCAAPELDKVPAWEQGYVSNEAAVAHDLIIFLDRFYDIFPEQRRSKLYLTGESYAGKYVPALAFHIHKVNENRAAETARPPIPLAGLAVGNGLTDPISQIATHSAQALALGLVGEAAAAEMDLFAAAAVSFICQQQWTLALQARETLFQIFGRASGNINYYDIRRGNAAYVRTPMYNLLNDAATKRALHVGEDAIYGKDWWMFPHLEHDIMKSSVGYFPTLLNGGYQILLYQGQFDFRDGVLSQNEWIRGLDWEHQPMYLKAPREPWYTVETGLAGYSTRYKNLARVEVLHCGHLCPGDTPSTSDMIDRFLVG
ncbi:hypothetical protein HDV03_000335 [Kappamyces sp. JEL0829]|nr:hypothetical protein HDV03_000335 [Kappamyces sp. JEL0829]